VCAVAVEREQHTAPGDNVKGIPVHVTLSPYASNRAGRIFAVVPNQSTYNRYGVFMNSDENGEERRKYDDVPLVLINGRVPGEREQLPLPLEPSDVSRLDFATGAAMILESFRAPERGKPGSKERAMCEALETVYAQACALSEMIRLRVPVEIRGRVNPATGEGFDLLEEAQCVSDSVLDLLEIARELYPLPSPGIDPMKVN
jgi:hypothetical protein